ncbi:DUF5320 domain-containing protein [Saccharicrinis aurantiacus]|uniref:DUF5320 domain-containing protein n=1 Tax=Saccharicrinis aurantiacus TaxID=1849719 RepID=UPI000839447C|nr:DUF5320 domain-containing protein [Saccharicrinis aurantiacus]
MPQCNGRGPKGMGPQTGQGLGRCNPENLRLASDKHEGKKKCCKEKHGQHKGGHSKHGKGCGHKHHEA